MNGGWIEMPTEVGKDRATFNGGLEEVGAWKTPVRDTDVLRGQRAARARSSGLPQLLEPGRSLTEGHQPCPSPDSGLLPTAAQRGGVQTRWGHVLPRHPGGQRSGSGGWGRGSPPTATRSRSVAWGQPPAPSPKRVLSTVCMPMPVLDPEHP